MDEDEDEAPKRGLVARLFRRRGRGGAAGDEEDAAEPGAAASTADAASKEQRREVDSDVEAEEAELYARRPLVRARRAAARHGAPAFERARKLSARVLCR